MQVFENYHLPTTVDEALTMLAQYEGRARVIAGGTDLLVDTQADYYEGHRPHLAALVDVTKIQGATEIREEGGFIVIGCGVTHTQIVKSNLIQQYGTALAEGCAVVGGPQVRNVATLCGNVAHALPAADGTVALMALGAEALVAHRNTNGVLQEWQPLGKIFQGPGKSAVDSTRELIAAVRFRPTQAGEASAFTRVMRPQGVALPILGMAVRVECTMDNAQWTMQQVAISAGPVAPTPFRAFKTEEFLRGKSLHDDVLRKATQILLSEVQPRTSAHRATKAYRIELLPTLLDQTLRTAIGRVM
ncbi:MAG TPA: FAD binding domain-containing protein [Anaerolineae bacterium]|nr:FAD binding domain-containing protein [Anaerolineae bacterium]